MSSCDWLVQAQVEGAWQHDMYAGLQSRSAVVAAGGAPPPIKQGKLLISNLDVGVSDSDIQVLSDTLACIGY